LAEHEVMWIGRRPASAAPVAHPATTEAFAEAVTAACANGGCDVQEYVAAAGAYGSWMVRFARGGERCRLVWNGKDGRLVLERATAGVDWDELSTAPVQDRDTAGFVSAVAALLAARPSAA
jgi:hypothetical protein